jgi:hypothetical protein
MHSTGMRKLLDRLSAERLQNVPDVALRRCASSSALCSPSRPSAWCPSGVQGCSRPWPSNRRTSPWERPSVVALPRASASPSCPCRPSPERPPAPAPTPVTVFVAADAPLSKAADGTGARVHRTQHQGSRRLGNPAARAPQAECARPCHRRRRLCQTRCACVEVSGAYTFHAVQVPRLPFARYRGQTSVSAGWRAFPRLLPSSCH